MKNPIKNYKFWVKIISAALLIAMGIWILVDNKVAKQLVLIFTALVFSIFSIIRFIPLMKTLSSGKSKLIIFLETVVHILLAVYLFVAASKMTTDPNSAFSNFNNQYYRFFIAFYLYSTAVVYFMCTVLYKEPTDKVKFWTHILLMTLACFICAFNNLTIQSLSITLAIIAFLMSCVLIIDSGKGYNQYRKSIIKPKKDKKNEEDVMELPSNTVPTIEDKPTDSNQIC